MPTGLEGSVSVYVDEFRVWAPTKIAIFRLGSCHLCADTDAELHEFARRIGLKRSWFQPHRLVPHYDLTRGRRDRALALGAVFVPAREQVRRRMAQQEGNR